MIDVNLCPTCGAQATQPPTTIEVDFRMQTLRHGGRALCVTHKEAQLLDILARNAGKIVKRAEIERALHEDDAEIGRNALEVMISRTRKKLAERGFDFDIYTIRGVGYALWMKEDVEKVN